jgi:glycosyltransferase involved in cell wall biosynthesis
MYELSVLIPARNEIWLHRTVEDVLANSRGDTEVIVVLDGYESKEFPGMTWPEPGIPVHERVTVIHHPVSTGQRASTNEAARVSTAPYIMKLDAHCALGEGFDVKLLEAAKELEDDVCQIPGQYNLHVFDWVCVGGAKADACGFREYQGPSGRYTKVGDELQCPECGGRLEKDVLWKRRKSRYATAWRFDQALHFQYWGKFKERQSGDLVETMSCLGACWFVSRKRFWELDGLDEGHGSWGQMGAELACKHWLSGGRLVCNKRTWFAHLFRTRGGDFGFPYPLSKNATDKARAYSRDLWLNNKWPKAKRPFDWIVNHFAPVPGWEGWRGGSHVEDTAGSVAPVAVPSAPDAVDVRAGDTDRAEPAPRTVTKGVVYYSDCRGDETILKAAQKQLVQAVNGHTIVAVTLGPVDVGDIKVILANRTRSYLTMFRQILAGLEMSDADVIFLAEHDVLYHASHFDFTPPRADLIYYNENTWKVDAKSGRALHYICRQTSGLCAYRELLLEHYRKRVALVEEHGFSRRMGFEPGTHGRRERVDDLRSEAWMSEAPNIDIRHGHNLTPSRWRQEQFRDRRNCRGWTEADEVPGWGRTKGRFAEILGGI